MLIKRLHTFSLALVFAAFSLSALADETLTKASQLLSQKNHTQAYDLLEPLESERAGDIEYDYLLGVAAIESGQPSRGVFALERVLAQQPNNVNARAMIAKGYFRGGETENARSEFQNILGQNPDPELSKLIEDNMSAVNKATGQATTFAAFIDGGFGFDSNINSATSNSTIAAPGIAPGLNLTLGSASQEQSSKYLSLTGGVSFRTPLSKNLSMFGAAQGSVRTNWNESAFDPSYTDFTLGLSYKRFIDNFTVAVQRNNFDIDGERFRKSHGITGQWQRQLDDQNQISIYAQTSDLNYPSTGVRDAQRSLMGAGWGHAFSGDKAPVVFVSGYVGKEDVDDSTFDFLSNDIYGARLGGQMVVNYKLVAYANTSYEIREHDERDPAFLQTRKDDQFDFSVGLRYLPIPGWIIKPQLSYMNNDSNIKLFDFDRTVLSVNFRKDFNW
ncbi:MAG: surface lipoprotein assembly modifier [Nitrosomonadales bacterium]|nr:surface lipoprotein assembly modifier [Nitrosomonadales bacterium]